MNKERELLKRCAVILNSTLNGTTGMRLVAEIEEVLAQPEQEPVAWMLIDKETGVRIPKAYKPEHKVNEDRWELYPLYAHPPKREPIDAFEALQESEGDYIYKNGFIDGIKYAEKAHGIGVDDE